MASDHEHAIWGMLFGLILLASNSPNKAYGKPQVPCYFIFGDSMYDIGNNNLLVTLAKANYPPYGIDFPEGPTGRFTNGRTIGDFIAEFLGFDHYIPPFSNTTGPEILKGVNYASAAAGIRNESGQNLGDVITMDKQLQNHGITISRIARLLGNKDLAMKYLSRCIYTSDMGGNDYLNNYLLPEYFNTSKRYTPEQYATVLAQQYALQLKRLYDFGARKIALMGLSRIGCLPYVMARYGTMGSSCVDFVNHYVQLFNNRLIWLVNDLNANLNGAKFTYINIYEIDPTGSNNQLGFRVKNASCCNAPSVLCAPSQTPCPNRNEYVFWDAAHTTEAANVIFAKRAYNSQLPTDAYPYDIKRLAQI